MYKLANIYGDIQVEYIYDVNTIEFSIENLITTRLKNTIKPEKIFIILNSYLDYKGKEFKEKLYKTLVTSHEIILINSLNKKIDPMPVEAVHLVLDLFDMDDVIKFVTESKIVKVPDVLAVTYDDTRELNDQGSREQTFLVSDYYELIALITVLKSVTGVIGMYATVRTSLLPSAFKDYMLFNFLIGHEIYELPAFVKLYEYVNKLVSIVANNQEEFSKLIIEKNVSREEFPTYVLGAAIFQRLVYTNELDDVNDKNVVTNLYHYVKNAVKLKAMDSSSKISIKTASTSATANEHESESILETYRVPTDITIGHVVEFKKVYVDYVKLFKSLKCENFSLLNKVLPLFKTLEDADIPDQCVYMVSWLLKHEIDARSIRYIRVEQIVVVLAIGFVWACENNMPEIAAILSSHNIRSSGNVFKFSIGHKSKLSPELKEKLSEIYPYDKSIFAKSGVQYVSSIEKIINTYSIELSKHTLVSVLDVKMLNELIGTTNTKNVQVPSDIKNKIGEFIVAINNV